MRNNTEKANNFGTKKSKLSVIPIIFSGIIAAGAIGGSVASIWQVSQNYTESEDFTKSVTGRVKIDPLAGYTDAEKHDITKQQVENDLQDCAEKLSRWLKDQGQKSYDVAYELYEHEDETDPDDKYEAYLNASFPVNKVTKRTKKPGEEEDVKIDDDPYLSFFAENGFNSNEKTLVYRWYLPERQTSKDADKPYYSVIPFRDIFNIPKKANDDSNKSKAIVDKDGKNGVLYAANDAKSTGIASQIFKNLKDAEKDSKKEDDQKPDAIKNSWGQPRLYVVNNINGLFNEANYHLSHWWSSSKGQDAGYLDIYKDSQYAGYASNYREINWNGDNRKSQEISYHRNYKLQSAKDYLNDGEEIANADIFNYIDQTTAGAVDANYSFASKYISEIITYDEVDKFMPKEITDDYKNDTESDTPTISYFFYPQTTKTEAETFINRQINYGFNKASLVDMEFYDITDDEEAGAQKVYDKFVKQYSYTFIQPSLTDTIFGGNNVVGVLSIGFLIFLIILLIVLAALYRTTGVMSWICMLFALSITLLISTIGSSIISMSLIIGMLTMSLVGFMACLAICERMRRRLNSNEDTRLIIKKTFKKSLLPIVDISFITLIFGVCFTYIAPISFNSLGIILITGSFATFISIFLLNGALHGLFFNNNYLVNRFEFFGKPTNVANEALSQSNAIVPNTLDATKLEFPYYDKMCNKKIDSTNKKALIAVCVVGAILVVAIVLFSVLGFTSSSMFHTSNCIAIKFSGDIFSQAWYQANPIPYVSYTHNVVDGTEWWFFYTNSSNAMNIALEMVKPEAASGLVLGDTITVQAISGSTNQDILNFALIAIIVSTLTSSVYAAIRYNWLSCVPMIAGSFGIPLLILGIAAVCQIKFDQFSILAYVLVTVVNTIFCANVLCSISETWSRKDAYTKEELKYILNTSLKNGWRYIWLMAAVLGAFILMFGLCAPISPSIVSSIGLFIISCIITIGVAPFALAFLTYQFMKIRNIILEKIFIKSKSKITVEYDEIDEQGLEGINQFTKRIPVASEKKPESK